MMISVVIPAYNAERWIAQCVESVLYQTYKDLEVIVVDDGSTDGTALIVMENYPTVRLIRQANGGLSVARNSGLDVATGEFVHFLDADDFLDLDYYERMVSALDGTDADVAIGGVNNGIKPWASIVFADRLLLSTPDDIFGVTQAGLHAYVWRYVIRRKFIIEHNFRFEPGRIFEDMLFTFAAFSAARRVVTVPGAVYYYMKRAGSIMNARGEGARTRARQWKIAKAFRRDFFRQKGLPLTVPIAETECRIFRIPMVHKTVLNNGKTRWYLFGLWIAETKKRAL